MLLEAGCLLEHFHDRWSSMEASKRTGSPPLIHAEAPARGGAHL